MFRLQSRILQTLSKRSSSLLQTRNYMTPNYEFRESIDRGREQYRVKNAIVSLSLCGLITGIYFYSMYAVDQEDYSDVPMPEEKKE
ncbi:hypothetical protein BB561_006310 [Smittium simulii]|uniref:Cytochrome c oxidase assembly factor 3 n=1 Tax=Smittium simulii TaxID=133385 RepID=A0A2T9Y583_9FUNG|nr:hypothetical protein BB561_006310 [Smittium simulii]